MKRQLFANLLVGMEEAIIMLVCVSLKQSINSFCGLEPTVIWCSYSLCYKQSKSEKEKLVAKSMYLFLLTT